MKRTGLVLQICLLGLTACSSRETPTLMPTAAPPQPASTPTAALASPTEPTATAVPRSVGAPAGGHDLSLYAPAMRPAFVGDLEAIGPVSRYRIELTVEPELSRLLGQQSVHFVNNDSATLDALYFRLFPNLPGYGGEMTVSNLRVAGQPAEGSLSVDDTALRVPLSPPLPAGGEVTVELDFAVTIPQTAGEGYGQFIYSQDVMALANFFPLIPSFDEANCARFGNCDGGWNIEYAVPYGDAVFSDTALFELLITAPEGWVVAASGTTVGKEDGTDGNIIWHVVSGPMRDINLALSPRFQIATQQVEDVTINSYYLPDDAAGGRRALKWTADSLAFFSDRIGPYPYAELDVVETPTVAGGIEYPGLIAMPIHNYDQTGGFFQWATVHEVGHQWWYSLVGNDQQDEPWLDEALVQHSTGLFYEFELGWLGYVDEVFIGRYNRVAGTELDDLISRPVAAYTDENYGAVVYGKGPLFFHELRQTLGDEAFFAFLQTYYQTYRYRVAGRAELLAAIDQAAGQDLSAFYLEWLGDF